MRRILHSGLVAVLPALLAGCLYDKVPEDDNPLYHRVLVDVAPVKPAKPSLTKEELTQIELEVCSYLLARDWDDNHQFSAVFIEGEESMTAALLKKFPHHSPPLKTWWHLVDHKGQAPLDADTGRPALILKADVDDPENGAIIAIGRWRAGEAITGFHTFELKPDGRYWKIQSVK